MAGIEKPDKTKHQLSCEDEERFRSLFMECPVSLWEEDITDLAAYLDSLRSSGITDLRAYFDQHPDEIIRRVGMIKVIEVNKATLALFEAPDKNILLANLSSIISEESLDTFREVLIAFAEGKKVFDTETVSRTLRGKILYINLRWSILPDSGGKLNRALISITDITDRKRAEEEVGMLKHSIDKYYDSAYWIDSDNKFVYVNDAACKALGYMREELIGMTINEVSPRANTELMKGVWAGLRQGGSFSIESVHRRKDGSEFPVEVVTTYVPFGGREYICGFARDITGRKETEKLLQQQRAQLEEAQRIANVGSWERDISTNAVLWSNEMMRIFGINPREGNPTFQMLLDMMHPDDAEPFQKAVRQAVFEKKPYSIEYRVVLGDGSTRFIHSRGEAQYDDSGKPVLFRGTAQDITERKRAEEALGASQKLLETIIEAAPS